MVTVATLREKVGNNSEKSDLIRDIYIQVHYSQKGCEESPSRTNFPTE